MTITIGDPRRSRTGTASLTQIAEYWRKNRAKVFPDLPRHSADWKQPFCFHCGWRTPQTRAAKVNLWNAAGGWLERAHLHDHFTGGPNIPGNLVPLCCMCHRLMPEFPESRDEAILWVKSRGHVSCPRWWQYKTDEWVDQPFPGRLDFINRFIAVARFEAMKDRGIYLAGRGDIADAAKLLHQAGMPHGNAVAAAEALAPRPDLAAAGVGAA